MKITSYLLIMSAVSWIYGCKSPERSEILPIALHPENPGYFIYRGKPTLLVGSGEHYGAVMNDEFNFEKYLQTLAKEGLNYTRIFTGPYSEMGNNIFGIENNTMNPAPGHWLTPWPYDTLTRKFVLNQWDPAFFERLHRFIGKARELGIIVEFTLFTSYYGHTQWNISPFNPKNNTLEGLDSLTFKKLNTMQNGPIMAIQEAYVRKMVKELNPYPNFVFEIQNEPWSDNPRFSETIPVDTLVRSHNWQKTVETANETSLDWQKQIAGFISSEEAILPKKHLIAQNISNFRCKVLDVNPLVSILNFHYAYPEAATWNLRMKRPLALDETGFMPHSDIYFRSEAWKFMLAGGATYNNLDYSFTVGYEDGTYKIADKTPGWGGVDYRKQVKVLKNFLESFQFLTMIPANQLLTVKRGSLNGYGVFAEDGKQYAIYLENKDNPEIEISLPDGVYLLVWMNPANGETVKSESVVVENSLLTLVIPEFREDIAVKIVKR